nr:hypothetical protein [Tanacetum cinerariifolium]
MDNPNFPNELNEDIPKENPVIPEPNHIEDAYDPDEMVEIPDDEDLMDYDGFAQHSNPQPSNMNGWLEEDDDWEDDVKRLMALLTPPGLLHCVLMRKIEEVSDAEVANSIAIEEIHPRVATVGEQVHVMESQAVQV